MPGRQFNNGNYRYGFNGKENDNEVKGVGNQQDYGMRIYDPRLGKFLSVDPLTSSYPELTPYQFASNSPIAGVDMDGLEFFYAANGTFLGQLGKSTEVRVVNGNKLKFNAVKAVIKAANNLKITSERAAPYLDEFSSNLGVKHDAFKVMAGVLYAESDGTTSEAVDEVAGIYSVVENRANYENTTVLEQMTVAKGVYGASEANKIDLADKAGMSTKKKAVIAGLIKGIVSETDFSNGAFYWDGKDFKKGGGHTERYLPGFEFTDKSHDLFNLGDNKKPGKANGVSWDYKYQSTGAKGKTTFSKLTDEWRDAQYSGDAKGKEVGAGKE